MSGSCGSPYQDDVRNFDSNRWLAAVRFMSLV